MVAPWAACEASLADFGDKRLNARMGQVLSALGNHPHISIPAACNGRAEMHAAYRFFDNDKVTFETVLAPHAQKTVERMRAQPVVLLIQDTTEINLSRPTEPVVGVGDLNSTRQGVLLHVMQAYTVDGTPLGTAWAKNINRTDGQLHVPQACKKRDRKCKAIEEKESFRWVQGLRTARELAGRLPQVQLVCIADSEADIYECLAETRIEPGTNAAPVDWIVRGCQNRALANDDADGQNHKHLREQVLGTKLLYTATLKIRGRQAKTRIDRRARNKARESREAHVEVRAATVTLRPPGRPDGDLPPVQVNVVLVHEPNPPAGEEPVQWMLITTLPIDTLCQVRTIVEYYCARWNIELLFKTLKSGCRVEERRFEHVERILPCLAMYLTVAWRTLFVCRMGREFPDADCELVFEPSEWKAVWSATTRSKPPRKRPRLSEMVHLIAQLGGYVESKTNEPGSQTIWVGLQRMYDLAWAWDSFGPGATDSH
jgi:Transposase DNA-binding/Transposase Tn5 dimerisation domain/Transposase DDE domain